MFFHISFLKNKLLHCRYVSLKLNVKFHECFNQDEIFVSDFLFYFHFCVVHILHSVMWKLCVLYRVKCKMLQQHDECVNSALTTIISVFVFIVAYEEWRMTQRVQIEIFH
jgi:hypothetical protein